MAFLSFGAAHYSVVPHTLRFLDLRAVVTLALNTALRKNEIRTLRWSQVDFEKRTVTVGKTKTQAGSARVIPLNQPALDALVKWAGRLVESNAEDYVFPTCEAAGIEREHPDRERSDPSRPIKSWRSAWCAALKRAGLSIRFHDLRHTCITKLAESQASEQTLMAIAGHVSRRMIELLAHSHGGKACGARCNRSAAVAGSFWGRCEPKREPTAASTNEATFQLT